MPIIVKATKGDSTNDLIRKFKKATFAVDIVDKVKERRYHVTDAEKRKVLKGQKRRLKKKVRSLKRMKNIPQEVITRLTERLSQ